MANLKPGCISCDIVAGKRKEPGGGTLFENQHWQVGMCMSAPLWPGFLMIKLKRHCEHIAELTVEEAASLGPTIILVTQAVTQVLNPAKVYVCSFGDGVKHIHIWILPRPQGMRPGMHNVMLNLDLRHFLTKHLRFRRWLLSDDEINELADRLRTSFATLTA